MHIQPGRIKTILIILFATLLLGVSSANGLRVSFGVGIPSEGAVPLTVRAAYPIATVHNEDNVISFLARLDVITTTAFSSAPTVALNALVSPQVSGLTPYFGAGLA